MLLDCEMTTFYNLLVVTSLRTLHCQCLRYVWTFGQMIKIAFRKVACCFHC